MGLLTKLTTDGSNYSQFDGATPPIPVGATDQSTLHDQYSLNGNPNQISAPQPSLLDLNGITPAKYIDNPPS
tara:strand:- start:235 stop:450 length:216 start_codon:yes stop_codon:yes gene_type:complete